MTRLVFVLALTGSLAAAAQAEGVENLPTTIAVTAGVSVARLQAVGAQIYQTVRKLHDLGIEWGGSGSLGIRPVRLHLSPERDLVGGWAPKLARIEARRLAQAATAAVIASTPRVLRARRKL
jgi:hypothetical protein